MFVLDPNDVVSMVTSFASMMPLGMAASSLSVCDAGVDAAVVV